MAGDVDSGAGEAGEAGDVFSHTHLSATYRYLNDTKMPYTHCYLLCGCTCPK